MPELVPGNGGGRPHPDEARLLAFVDAELTRHEASEVAQHLSDCSRCSDTVQSMRQIGEQYRSARKLVLPPPPRAWSDLGPMLRTKSRQPRISRVSLRWAAAVAAALAIALLIPTLSTRNLNAAELLREAVVAAERRAERRAERQNDPPRRIRVKTTKAQFTRLARQQSTLAARGEEQRIAMLFEQARYSWDEPLSPKAFADWRDQLAGKDDRVRILNDTEWGTGRFYRIATTTPTGSLAEASITIRASDRRAVQQTFRFRSADEFVEVSELPDEQPGTTVTSSEAGTSSDREVTAQPSAARSLTASDELRVVGAIHSIGADLGEPVDVLRDDSAGRIIVTALAADAERQAQLRTALAGIPFIELRFEQPEELRRPAPIDRAATTERAASNESAGRKPRASGTVQGPTALQDRLASTLGSRNTADNFTDHVLDLSEAALARAHALRSLARRFSATVETQLSPADIATLRKIEEDHTRALLASVREMNEVIRPVVKEQGTANQSQAFNSWQDGAVEVLQAAREVDGILTTALAGGEAAVDPDDALSSLGRSARGLQERVARLQTVIARAR
ncbi:MAG: zf-HC2 domain-containing protein [Bryobacteraceae bacterium]|nr:zf-HC2 domain-containing protein [Bryobacteraceae bacterium]